MNGGFMSNRIMLISVGFPVRMHFLAARSMSYQNCFTSWNSRRKVSTESFDWSSVNSLIPMFHA